MGVYFKWICRARQEQLDPGELDESVKWPWGPKTVAALSYAVHYGPWIGQQIELLSDRDDLYYDIDDCASSTGTWHGIEDECARAPLLEVAGATTITSRADDMTDEDIRKFLDKSRG